MGTSILHGIVWNRLFHTKGTAGVAGWDPIVLKPVDPMGSLA